MAIEIIQGNLFDTDATFICHQVNCQGVMGSGVAKQVKERFPMVFEFYKREVDAQSYKAGLLGKSQFISTGDNKVIVNMFAQLKFGKDRYEVYTSYSEFENCLDDIVRQLEMLKQNTQLNLSNYDIAMPYLVGCYRGGGDWNVVYKLIEEKLKNYNVKLYRWDGEKMLKGSVENS